MKRINQTNTKKYAEDFLNQIENCINEKLKGQPKIKSAVVSSVNDDQTVNIYFPPDKKNIFTHIQNQTIYSLEEGDSVELTLKDGTFNNCWISAKHQGNNLRISQQKQNNSIFIGGSSQSGGTTAGSVRYDIIQTLTDSQKEQARNNISAGTSNFNGDYNSLINVPIIPTKFSELINDENFIDETQLNQSIEQIDENLSSQIEQKIDISLINQNNGVAGLNENGQINFNQIPNLNALMKIATQYTSDDSPDINTILDGTFVVPFEYSYECPVLGNQIIIIQIFLNNAQENNSRIQIAFPYNDTSEIKGMAKRIYFLNNTWSEWESLFTNLNPPTAENIGVYDNTQIDNKFNIVNDQISNLSAIKADLDSPVFTGTPKVPNISLSSNDNTIVNSAFVQELVSSVTGGSVISTGTSTDGNLVSFQGTSGKIIEDSGISKNKISMLKVITLSDTQPDNQDIGDFWFKTIN